MMTRERFAETNWKMSYEEYQKCDCTECVPIEKRYERLKKHMKIEN